MTDEVTTVDVSGLDDAAFLEHYDKVTSGGGAVAPSSEEEQVVETPETEEEDNPSEEQLQETEQEEEEQNQPEVETDPNTEESEEKDPKVEEEVVNTSEEVLDYEALYKQITEPFKANGREMQVKTPQEAKRLMQMGANYGKKMQVLKPALSKMKMLEKEGLLDEEKLSFLIDLSKKDKAAISKLIKDSGIDPLDLTDGVEYVRKSYAIPENQLAIEEIFDSNAENPSFQKVISEVHESWDEASKKYIAHNPEILKILSGHAEQGYYDKVMTELQREKLLGNLDGVSDIEAYRVIGDKLNAQGAFGQKAPAPRQKPVVQKPATESARIDKRKSAAPTRSTGKTKTSLILSDLASVKDEDLDAYITKLSTGN